MINQLTILGHLVQNATVKHANGTIITKFSVATKKSWKDENNEWQEKSQWHQVVFIWNRTVFQARFSFEASFPVILPVAQSDAPTSHCVQGVHRWKPKRSACANSVRILRATSKAVAPWRPHVMARH